MRARAGFGAAGERSERKSSLCYPSPEPVEGRRHGKLDSRAARPGSA